MKNIGIPVIVVFAVLLVVETVFNVLQYGNLQRLNYQVLDLKTKEIELTDLNNQLSYANSQLEEDQSANLVTIAQLSARNASLSEDNAKQLEQVDLLNGEISKLKKEIDEKKASVSKLQSENISIKGKFMCIDTFSNVDFTNNESVNKSLTSYVEKTKSLNEPISAHYWNLIWTGSKYSIHTIEVFSEKDRINYIWKFTVYFRGEAHGNHENGIFYNDDQCWMFIDK